MHSLEKNKTIFRKKERVFVFALGSFLNSFSWKILGLESPFASNKPWFFLKLPKNFSVVFLILKKIVFFIYIFSKPIALRFVFFFISHKIL